MSRHALLSIALLSLTMSVAAYAGLKGNAPSKLYSADAPLIGASPDMVQIAAAGEGESSTRDNAWQMAVQTAAPTAASECGVVAIKNAPAALIVTMSESGTVSKVDVDSTLFGGQETESCLLKQFTTVSVGNIERTTAVRVELTPIKPGCLSVR